MHLCECVLHVCRKQKWVSYSLELELRVVVSHPMWVRGTKLMSSEEQEVLLATATAP